jgi:hypothetical protein
MHYDHTASFLNHSKYIHGQYYWDLGIVQHNNYKLEGFLLMNCTGEGRVNK